MQGINNTKLIGGVAILLIIIGLGYLFIHKDDKKVLFSCSDSKTITATFYPNSDTKVYLELSDGRDFTLPHVISASGARYASEDEAIVFWNKGEAAFLTEGSSTTFSDCTIDTGTSAVTTTNDDIDNGTGASGGATTGGAVKTDGLNGYANAPYNFTMRFAPTVKANSVF